MKGGFPIGEGAVHDDLGQGFQGGAHAGYAISNGVVVLGQGFHGGVHVGRGGAKPDALFRFPKSEGPSLLYTFMLFIASFQQGKKIVMVDNFDKNKFKSKGF